MIFIKIKTHSMESKSKILEKEVYICPDIDVLIIETEQNVLSGGSGNGDLDSMGGSDW